MNGNKLTEGNGNSSSLHEMYHIRGHTESHPLCQNNLLTSTAVEIRMGAKKHVPSRLVEICSEERHVIHSRYNNMECLASFHQEIQNTRPAMVLVEVGNGSRRRHKEVTGLLTSQNMLIHVTPTHLVERHVLQRCWDGK